MRRLAHVYPPQAKVRLRNTGIQIERLDEELDRLIISSRTIAGESEGHVSIGVVRIQTNRAFEFRVALFITAHHAKTESVPHMRCGITSAQFNRSLKFAFRGHKIVVIPHRGPG